MDAKESVQPRADRDGASWSRRSSGIELIRGSGRCSQSALDDLADLRDPTDLIARLRKDLRIRLRPVGEALFEGVRAPWPPEVRALNKVMVEGSCLPK